MRAKPLGIVEDVEPDQASAQGFEDAARADGIADTLVDAVVQWNLEVVTNVGKASDLNRVDQEIAAQEQVLPLCGRSNAPVFAASSNEPLGDLPRQFQALRIDFYQSETPFIQPLDQQNVGHELTSENGTSGP